MRTEFIVYGEPRGKGRPRFSNRGGFVKAYTPGKTVLYENLVRTEYVRQCEGTFFKEGVPLGMLLTVYLPIPKSASKKKREQMIAKKILPLKKPDSSNVLKTVEDGLNKVAYYDDTQFCDTRVIRYYGEEPRVEVAIWEIENEDPC